MHLRVPGFRLSQLDLSLTSDRLTVFGSRALTHLELQTGLARSTTLQVSYEVPLPVAVDPDRLVARVRQGVLEIRLFKADTEPGASATSTRLRTCATVVARGD